MPRRVRYGSLNGDNVLTALQPLSFPDVHISDHLYDKLVHHGEKVLLIDGKTGDKFTANDVREMSVRMAQSLLREDLLQQEDIVFCACPDSVLSAVTILAIHLAGAIYSGCYWTMPKREIQFQLETLGATVIVCGCHNLSDACSVADEVDSVTAVICVDPITIKVTDKGKQVFSIDKLLSTPKDNTIEIPATIRKNPKDATCCIMFSSGSTGMPKGVVVSHANAMAQCYAQISNDINNNGNWEGHIEAGTVGFAHTVGLTIIRLAVLSGTQIVVQDNFQLENFLQTVEKYKCTSAWLSPSEVMLLSKTPLTGKYDISSLREVKVGGSTLPATASQAFYAKTGNQIKITTVYGLTESGDLTHVPIEESDPGTVGSLLPGHEMKVVDRESGKGLPVSTVGEIYVRGPQLTPGYYNRAEANSENFTADGWFKSGDMGYINSDGLVYIIGRFKEVIKGDGEQVAPAELESLLLTHDWVAEAAVIGIPDEKHCEVPMAFIVLKDSGARNCKREILEFVNSQVADYKKIRGGIEFVPSLPKISIGKIDRMALKRRPRSPSIAAV